MRPAATLTAFGLGLAAVFGAAYAVGGAVAPLSEPPPVSIPHAPAPDAPGGHNEQQHPTGNPPSR